MREIKFRGFRKDENGSTVITVKNEKVRGDWVYGYLIGNDVIVGDAVVFYGDYLKCEYWYRVTPETVGQFTGLTDEKGNEIYEGDLVSTDLDRHFNVVQYRNGSFMFQCYDDGKTYYDYAFSSYEDETQLDFGKVIGNIYENPELLEESK